MDVYSLYKPLRNYTRQFSIIDSLQAIRAYLQYFQFGEPIPKDIEVLAEVILQKEFRKYICEWELDVLTREIIINGQDGGNSAKSLKNWKHFSIAIKK